MHVGQLAKLSPGHTDEFWVLLFWGTFWYSAFSDVPTVIKMFIDHPYVINEYLPKEV